MDEERTFKTDLIIQRITDIHWYQLGYVSKTETRFLKHYLNNELREDILAFQKIFEDLKNIGQTYMKRKYHMWSSWIISCSM